MSDPFKVVRDFERALCDYTGARFAVTVNSCTMALLLACAWHRHTGLPTTRTVTIPKRTYVSVPMSIIHAGYSVAFRDEEWTGDYRLAPLPVWDSARRFTSDMVAPGMMHCVSFHWSKTLGIQQGGAILHDNFEADSWLRRARFDGRNEGVAPILDTFTQIGWHCYMSPEVAAAGLVRLRLLPKVCPDLPNDNYPDLSKMRIFQ